MPTGLEPAPGFLVAYRTAAQIDLLRVRSDAADTDTALVDYTRYCADAGRLGADQRQLARLRFARHRDRRRPAAEDYAKL